MQTLWGIIVSQETYVIENTKLLKQFKCYLTFFFCTEVTDYIFWAPFYIIFISNAVKAYFTLLIYEELLRFLNIIKHGLLKFFSSQYNSNTLTTE